jgi:hypothetical protein
MSGGRERTNGVNMEEKIPLCIALDELCIAKNEPTNYLSRLRRL